MSAYTTQAAIQTRISPQDLLAALDDNGNGTFNSTLLAALIASVSMDIDGRLAAIYTVPFNPAPPTIQAACLILVCEAVYKRRLTPEEKNIYTPEADMWRGYLDDISTNKRDLDASQVRAFPPVVSFNQPLSTLCSSR